MLTILSAFIYFQIYYIKVVCLIYYERWKYILKNFLRNIFKSIKINCSLLLCYISVTIFLFMMVSNYLETKELNKISRGFLTVKSQEYTINGDINFLEFEKFLTDNLPKKGAIFRKDFSGEDIVGIYNKEGFKSPPLIMGRFLSEEESFSNKKLAVIGQGLKHGIVNKDGKEFIKVNNMDYEVIGIVGKDYSSRLDSMVFIPMTSINEVYGIGGEIIVDGIKNTESFMDKIKSEIGGNFKFTIKTEYESTVSTLDPSSGEATEEVFSSKDLNKNSFNMYIYYIVFLSAILCIVSMSIYWYQKRKKEISVCNILGFYRQEIFIRCAKKYVAVLISGGLIGTIISLVILNLI